MNPLLQMLLATLFVLRGRYQDLRQSRSDAGDALQVVILVVGMAALAVLVVGAITAAVKSRLDGLK